MRDESHAPPDPSWLDPVSKPPSERWPAAPLRAVLDARAITYDDLAVNLDTSIGALKQVFSRVHGLTTEQAIRLCQAIGTVPAAVWTDWNSVLGIRAWEPMPWRRWARCIGENHLFFGPPGERPETAEARGHFAITEYCDHCPVRPDCRAYARRNREYGVWGGETELERALAGYGPEMPIGTVAQAMKVARVYGGEGR